MHTVKNEFEMQKEVAEAAEVVLAVAGRDTPSMLHYKVQEGSESSDTSLIISNFRSSC